MKYLLDTNTCIRYLNRRSESIIHKMETVVPDEIVVCSVTRAELLFGAMKSKSSEKTLKTQREFLAPLATLPFDDMAAEHYARIRAKLEIAGKPIGPNDLLIASIGLAQDLIVVTSNVREFSRVDGLKIEDWDKSM
jgi:tRNA(fMet)-specific endonuclease VapC